MTDSIRITITKTAGSTPRDAATQMMVWADRTDGTIGGGRLEFDAIARARTMLKNGSAPQQQTIPLGPRLGQCCGGSVSLLWEQAGAMTAPQTRPLWIYGAGHVGRAIVNVMAPLPDFTITWIDTSADRFPQTDITTLIATDPAAAVKHAPANADHLILTYSHDMDLALCHAILSRDFHSVGLIGSATKWARFQSRLAALGHTRAQIARIACPIGDPSLGKHPAALALGVATAMIADQKHRTKDRTA
ncbi:xanthine dehydrogenase accessory protein XdhC [Loktanella sp. D2R18]|uniref:xanthine dehydrogenase accessory protein XdhC n=1 Tax=Rhodobacterales TaxID=204455 RepID=UPI000DEBAE35|nr:MULTISPECIES: xanthine dehydrogenase accessory protein XdhC [Rhodobacterales]MDO6591087.1 xanthine dehydrogenase accessory protein XdhC [Yoonia sp. 1_MG-2023]RBW42163.1 xanthine dehydrogenase accessory protein XdhC [Loktanella sp. D2R18]